MFLSPLDCDSTKLHTIQHDKDKNPDNNDNVPEIDHMPENRHSVIHSMFTVLFHPYQQGYTVCPLTSENTEEQGAGTYLKMF